MGRIEAALKEVVSCLEEYEFKKGVDSIMALADYGNTYFQSHEPWKLVKNDKQRAGSVLRSCLQIAKALIILMDPVMPAKMEEAWKQLGMSGLAEKLSLRMCCSRSQRPNSGKARDTVQQDGKIRP